MSPVCFLLVDDLEENLVSLEALLRKDDLVLLKAKSGDEALELLLQNDVALALIDVQMPGLSGFELAELMRGNQRTRHIPIIFVTAGSVDNQRRFRGYEAGAVDFIQKPIEADVLRSKADVFYELCRQRQQIAAQRDELEAHAEALKEAGRRKDEFLIMLTHDISQHENARALQNILLQEINHRIKNLFSIAAGLITLSAESSTSVAELARDLMSRLKALARAHELTLPDLNESNSVNKSATTLITLIKVIVAPHEHVQSSRIAISGSDASLSSNSLTALALLLHELTTNAAKYGALSSPTGRLNINVSSIGELLQVKWDERSPAPLSKAEPRKGFGTTLENAVLKSLGGTITRDWNTNGLSLSLKIPLVSLCP